MNKTRLKINRINEDVISTSDCVNSLLGCYYKMNSGKFYYDYFDASKNLNDNNEILETNIPNEIKPLSADTSYCYHADQNGGFIEWCPSAGADHTDVVGAMTAHGVEAK